MAEFTVTVDANEINVIVYENTIGTGDTTEIQNDLVALTERVSVLESSTNTNSYTPGGW